jgi:hypothetical protein
MNVSEERLKELAGSKNKQGKPLIEKIEEEIVVEPIEKVERKKRQRNARKVTE